MTTLHGKDAENFLKKLHSGKKHPLVHSKEFSKFSKMLKEFLEEEAKKEKCKPETCMGQCQGMNSNPECPHMEDDEPQPNDRLIRSLQTKAPWEKKTKKELARQKK